MQDQEKHSNSNMDDHDEFGLPEVEYSPINRENETPPAFEKPTYYAADKEDDKKGWVIAGVLGFFFLVGLVVYLLLFDGAQQIGTFFGGEPEQSASKEVVEKKAASRPEIKKEPQPEPEPEVVAEENQLAPYEGITTISQPTGRSYIVIASFVDEDMAMDFGNKMLNKGVGVKIIQPTGRSPLLHRVVVADFAVFREAMAEVKRFRSEYGEKSWVLKY